MNLKEEYENTVLSVSPLHISFLKRMPLDLLTKFFGSMLKKRLYGKNPGFSNIIGLSGDSNSVEYIKNDFFRSTGEKAKPSISKINANDSGSIKGVTYAEITLKVPNPKDFKQYSFIKVFDTTWIVVGINNTITAISTVPITVSLQMSGTKYDRIKTFNNAGSSPKDRYNQFNNQDLNISQLNSFVNKWYKYVSSSADSYEEDEDESEINKFAQDGFFPFTDDYSYRFAIESDLDTYANEIQNSISLGKADFDITKNIRLSKSIIIPYTFKPVQVLKSVVSELLNSGKKLAVEVSFYSYNFDAHLRFTIEYNHDRIDLMIPAILVNEYDNTVEKISTDKTYRIIVQDGFRGEDPDLSKFKEELINMLSK